MEKMFKPAYTFIPPDTFIWHSKVMPYIIYWFIGWRFSSRFLFSAGFDSEISFLFSWQTRSVWSPLFSSPLLSSEEEDDDDEGSCWTLIWTSLSKDEISQLITLLTQWYVFNNYSLDKNRYQLWHHCYFSFKYWNNKPGLEFCH